MSESESDNSGVSVVSTRSARSRGRRLTYRELSDHSSSQDSREEVIKRLAEVLGSDSDQDEEYVPEKKKKKKEKVLPEKEKKKTEKALPEKKERELVPPEKKKRKELASKKRKRSSKDQNSRNANDPSTTKPACNAEYSSQSSDDSDVQEILNKNEAKRAARNAKKGAWSKISTDAPLAKAGDFVGVQPTLHQNRETKQRRIQESRSRPTQRQNRRVQDAEKGPEKFFICSEIRSSRRFFKLKKTGGRNIGLIKFINFYDHLKESLRILNSSGNTGGVCSLWAKTLAANISLFGGDVSFTRGNPYVQLYSNQVSDCLGLEVVEAVVNCVKTPQLRASLLNKIGEEICGGWGRGTEVLAEIFSKLLKLGALQDANDLTSFYSTRRSVTAQYEKERKKEINSLKVSKNLVEMMKDLEKLASEEALSDAGTINNMLADAVIQEMEELLMMDEWGATYAAYLPLISTYIVQNRDVDSAVSLLTKFRDKYPHSFRAHVTLLDLMHSQQWEEDSIAEALLLAGEQFPHHSFVVDYCQAVLQQEENLDESFSSENSDPPLGPDHARLFGMLVVYLDYRGNVNDKVAWSLLLTSTLNLLQSNQNQAVIQDLLKPRLDWWFEQNVEDLVNCDTNSLGAKMSVVRLLRGASNPIYLAIRNHLRYREEGGDLRAKAALAEAEIIANKQDGDPILAEALPDLDEVLASEWETVEKIVADERAAKIAPGQSQQILEHMTNKTDKYQCDKCDKYYTYYYLDQHKKLHHSGVSCAACNKPFVSKEALKRHKETPKECAKVLEKSAGPPWTCDACGSVYQQYCNLTRHKKHPKNCRENIRNGWAWVGKDHKVDVRTNERVGKKEKKKGRAAAARPQGRRVSARKQKRRGENEDDHQAEPAELGTHFMAL